MGRNSSNITKKRERVIHQLAGNSHDFRLLPYSRRQVIQSSSDPQYRWQTWFRCGYYLSLSSTFLGIFNELSFTYVTSPDVPFKSRLISFSVVSFLRCLHSRIIRRFLLDTYRLPERFIKSSIHICDFSRYLLCLLAKIGDLEDFSRSIELWLVVRIQIGIMSCLKCDLIAWDRTRFGIIVNVLHSYALELGTRPVFVPATTLCSSSWNPPWRKVIRITTTQF